MRCAFACLFLMVVLASCEGGEDPVPRVDASAGFEVTSSYGDGEAVPVEFTCDGAEQSPPLSWSSPEGRVDEYALTMVDPDAPGGDFVHWVVWGISGTTTRLDTVHPSEGSGLPTEAVEGTNDFGDIGYGGPCPPGDDEPHRYVITVYALEGSPTSNLEEGTSARDFIDAIVCCVRATAELAGTYGRP